MAVIVNFRCTQCGEHKQEAVGPGLHPSVCSSCENENREADKKAELKKLDDLTTEARLRRIEEWIYEHGQNHPMREQIF